MALKDRMGDALDAARRVAPGQSQSEDDPAVGPKDHYEAVVNKKDLSVTGLTRELNRRWANGWRLAHILEQHGNTVMIYERRPQSQATSPQPVEGPPAPGWWKASDGKWYPPR